MPTGKWRCHFAALSVAVTSACVPFVLPPAAAADGTSSSPPAGLAGVRGRVLRAGEMRGFAPQGRRLFTTNAHSWGVSEEMSGSQLTAFVSQLKREGFVAALRENVTASASATAGVSIVERFRSSQGARAELAANIKQDKAAPSGGHPFESFVVSGIPGASGFGYEGITAANVAFTKGAYYYLVGAEGAASGTASARATVIAAARHLYQRVPA